MAALSYSSFKDHPLTAISFYKHTTRFEPTASGPLHLGHLYLILVNQHEARESGGRFVFRVDDNSPEWVWRVGQARMQEYIDGYRRDLEWLGIEPDIWLLQSELHDEVVELRRLLAPDWKAEERVMFTVPWVPGDDQVVYYPYAPYLTIDRVIMDTYSGVTYLIRGADLLTEHNLYLHLCDRLGLPAPRCVYLPRLKLASGSELLGNISKTSGGHSIESYRSQGTSPEYLLESLKLACLKDPGGEWSVSNVRREPIWIWQC